MDYISVKETSKKFHLSERRIQKLCETNRIEGCKMVSGIWLIPASATKPSDERMTNFPKDSDYLSLKELCDILSISTATGRNWIKLGKLIPEYTDKRKPYFTKQYTEKLKAELQSGKNQSLKSRRNKKFVCGNSLYSAYVSENCQNIEPLQQILRIVTDESIALSSDVIQYFIADCALHLLAQKYDLSFKHEKALLSRFLRKEITLSLYDELIYALIADSEQALLFCEKYSPLFDFDYVYEPAEDILGLIYISCKNIGSRKAVGTLVRSGAVAVNGQAVRKSDIQIDPEKDEITVNGKPVRYSAFVYIMLYKPSGVLTATRDSRAETVLDLLPPELKRRDLFPAGRLDKDTTGLLVLTNDGEYAHRMLAPKSHVWKRYRATLDLPAEESDIARFAAGIKSGENEFAPAVLEISKDDPHIAWTEIREGKFHQVKRMFSACGKTVTALHRESIGALTLDPTLTPGEAKILDPNAAALVFEKPAQII